jgi:hypothetical protein
MRWLIALAFMLVSSAPSLAADALPVQKGRSQPGVVTFGPDREQLAIAPRRQEPPQFTFLPGRATHPDDQMNPFNPGDQQRNQSHGLTTGPGDDIPLRPLFGG